MAAGISMKVSYLIELMLAGVGQRGAEDLKYHWFETIYSAIREQPWPWNFKRFHGVTTAPIVSTELYTWTATQTFVTGGAALSLTYLHTGRAVEIDNREYFVTQVDVAAFRIYLDKPLHTTQSTGGTLTFYRADHAVRTSSISEVQVDGYRIESTSPDYWRKWGGFRGYALSGSKPNLYEVRENQKIDPPLYLPVQQGAPGAGTILAGTYEYFFTFYDTESGLESNPGPTVQFTHPNLSNQQIGYNNPGVFNTSEGRTYQLRLWRSKASPSGSRYAAWLVGTKDPTNAAANVLDAASDSILIGQERYYAGNVTVINFHQWPDARYSIDVRGVEGWGARPDPGDMLELGRNNIVTELLPMGASTYIELANRDVQSHHVAIRKWRSQLAYLVRKTDVANANDPGIEEISFYDGVPNSEAGWDPIDTYKWHN